MKAKPQDETEFINVDLEVSSRSSLDALVTAFKEELFLLYSGKYDGINSANFEVYGSWSNAKPEKLIKRFVSFVEKLPSDVRRVWDRARARDFNIGISVARKARPYELCLPLKALQQITSVKGRLIITVYAPTPGDISGAEKKTPKGKKRRTPNQAL
jgi:hypothetical protein